MCDECRDHRAITDKINLYATLIDGGQPREAVYQVFAADATEDHGEGLRPREGWEDIADLLEEAVAPFAGGMHLNTNVTITVDGDTARSHSYYLGVFWFQGAGDRSRAAADWVSAGRYDDVWRRFPDGWRITARRRSNVGLSSVVLGARPGHLLAMQEPAD